MTPPLLVRRYAKALFDAAQSARALEPTERALGSFAAFLEEEPGIAKSLTHPRTSADVRREVLGKIIPAEAPEAFLKFVHLIFEKRPDLSFRLLEREFRGLLLEAKGQIAAEVVSPQSLSAGELEKIRQTFKIVLGKDPVLTERVDKTLLGGIMVKAGDRIWDGSLRARLQQMKNELIKT